MRRLFWLAMGITIGALIVRKLSKAAEKLTPQGIAGGIAQGLADLADSIRDFGEDVRDAMRERETQLRESTGMDGQLGRTPETTTATGTQPQTRALERPDTAAD